MVFGARPWLIATLALVLACRASSSSPGLSEAPTAEPEASPTPASPSLSLTIFDPEGQPIAGLEVGVRGSYDARPRARARSDASGRVDLSLDEPGLAFVTLGEASRALVTYGSSVTADTLVVWVEGGAELQLRHGPEGTSLASSEAELWPLFASNAEIESLFEALVATARKGDETELRALVDAQRAAIEAKADPRLRSLLAIHYATFAAQAVGPQPALELLERVPPEDRAWVAQATHLRELLWVLGDEALVAQHIAALREHHDDPGLRAALLAHELAEADAHGDFQRVTSLYRALEDPRYAETIAWRSARRYDPERAIAPGKQLPAFAVERCDEAGTPLTNDDLLGKAWVIQVWATWCGPCLEELDAMPTLYAQLAGLRERVELLSISVDEDRALTLATLASRELAWPSAWAPDEEALLEAWGFAGVPLTLVVDAEGRVVEVWDGRVSMDRLEQAVRQLLDE